MIGKSGHGKSTLINMIPNLLMDRKYEDERLIAIPQTKDMSRVDGTGIDKVLLKCNIPAFLNKKSGDGVKKQNQSQTESASTTPSSLTTTD
jgi:energy-coupling factor transporter ATP-binding protein EcfA2